jgi:hypothetical protein
MLGSELEATVSPSDRTRSWMSDTETKLVGGLNIPEFVPSGSLLPFSEPSTTTPQKKTRFVWPGADDSQRDRVSSPVERGIILRGDELRAMGATGART